MHQWIEITRDERAALREELKNWAGAFGDLQAMVEGRMPVDHNTVAAASRALAVLNGIGWEVEQAEGFELPDRPEVMQFLVAVRDRTADTIPELEAEREEGEPENGPEVLEAERRIAAVCESILERPSFGDPVIGPGNRSGGGLMRARGQLDLTWRRPLDNFEDAPRDVQDRIVLEAVGGHRRTSRQINDAIDRESPDCRCYGLATRKVLDRLLAAGELDREPWREGPCRYRWFRRVPDDLAELERAFEAVA
jgi:hypothetical protein